MRHGFRLTLIITALLSLASTAFAQSTEPISIGTFTTSSIDPQNPGRFYEFPAVTGQLIGAEVIALDNTLDPRLTLLSSAQTALATSTNDPFQPGTQNARITYLVPADGTYTLFVESENSTAGSFLLRLNEKPVVPTEPLSSGILTTASVSAELPSRAFSFDSSVGNVVGVRSPAPGVGFIVEVRSADGQTVAIQRGPLVTFAQTVVASNSGLYTVIVSTAQANQSATLEISFGSEGDATTTTAAADTSTSDTATVDDTSSADTTTASSDGVPTAPVNQDAEPLPTLDPNLSETPSAVFFADGNSVQNAPTDRCTVSPEGSGGVNIRQEPTTSAPVIASIPPGEFRFADGTDGAWIRLTGGGWVSSGVVEQSAPCTGLPFVTGDLSGVGSGSAGTTTTTEATAVPDVSGVGQR
ncbi:MAG: SH3 domain-containing protein [Chloroflexota bacterium]